MIDAHAHSTHSPDGQGSIRAMIEAAREERLTGIALTEHAEWYPADEAYGYLNLEVFFSELEEARTQADGEIIVQAGVELGNPHEFSTETKALQAYPFDLMIGSVHWIDRLPGWKRDVFSQGLEETYRCYFNEVLRMVTDADFDILGHLDIVRRDSWDLFHETLTLEPYAEVIDEILRRLIAAGRGLEINTSGLRKGLSDTLPSMGVLRRYRELGGEIVVFGSDAHRPEDVGADFKLARDIALTADFHRTPRYERRRICEWIDLERATHDKRPSRRDRL